MIVSVLLPGFWPGYSDSFPLSNYPMFTTPRSQVRIDRMIGVLVDEKGIEEEITIPSEFIGAFEVMQAASIIRSAVRGGRETQRKLCRSVAENAANSVEYSEMSKVLLVKEFYSPVQYFTGDSKPLQRIPIDYCAVRKPN